MIVEPNVFSPALRDELRKYLRLKSMFIPATVTGDPTWRSGRVAHIQDMFIGKLVAEAILTNYHPAPWSTHSCEVQLSSYGDGDYFRVHTDNATPDCAKRQISWVSYLNAWPGPNRYTGGELIVYEAAATVVYTPADGETVFFPSSVKHEIKPVSAPPGWDNRRMSVNGWIS